MATRLKALLHRVLPPPIYTFLRVVFSAQDCTASFAFLRDHELPLSHWQRLRMLARLYWISLAIESPHRQSEILAYIRTILVLPIECPGVLVEAGCFKGSSTAKFSLAAKLAQRELVVFDSFEGIPDNDEFHGQTIFGGEAEFKGGDYCASLDEVKRTVKRFGSIESCRFVKGYFENSLPEFKEMIAAAYLDVDLLSSTKTCLKYFYPLLPYGGELYSQDGHLPLIIDLLKDEQFWRQSLRCQPPRIDGLGTSKLVRVVKGANDSGEQN